VLLMRVEARNVGFLACGQKEEELNDFRMKEE
jgi:hypothetical protein